MYCPQDDNLVISERQNHCGFHYLSNSNQCLYPQVHHLMKVVGSGCGSTFASRWSFARLWWHISCSQRITHLYISKKSKPCLWLHTATHVELVSYWSSQCRNIPSPALATYLCAFQARWLALLCNLITLHVLYFPQPTWLESCSETQLPQHNWTEEKKRSRYMYKY